MFELMPFGSRRVSYYDPFRAMEEMSRRFWDSDEMTGFRTDITEKDGNFILEAELPGFDKDDIRIDLEKDRLTISAERSSDKEDKDDERSYVRRERFYGSYSRSFNVSGIDTDAITASYDNGVLKLTMPRKTPEVPASRRLEIS